MSYKKSYRKISWSHKIEILIVLIIITFDRDFAQSPVQLLIDRTILSIHLGPHKISQWGVIVDNAYLNQYRV